jgi:threonine dehydrogenase-like Zn-dependent dehydrogenase
MQAPTQVIVEIMATGICGTDVGIVSGRYHAMPGVILGHESTGVVVDVGSAVTSVRVGDRVVINPTYSCGQCRMCLTGRANHCVHKSSTESGVSSDGTFARWFLTEERMLHILKPHVSYEEATLTEPLSCCFTGVEQLRLFPEMRTVVVGGGPMGVLYAWSLARLGVKGVLCELSDPRRLESRLKLPSGWGCTATLQDAVDIAGSGENLVDLIVDTTGAILPNGLSYLARGGEMLLVGLKSGSATIDPFLIADRSWRIVGSIDTLNGSFERALAAITDGSIPCGTFISHRFPLNEYREAFRLLGCDIESQGLSQPARALKILLNGFDAR